MIGDVAEEGEGGKEGLGAAATGEAERSLRNARRSVPAVIFSQMRVILKCVNALRHWPACALPAFFGLHGA